MATWHIFLCGVLFIVGSVAQDTSDGKREPPTISSPDGSVGTRWVFTKIVPSPVNYTCVASGIPPPKYEWYRGNVKLPGSFTNIAVNADSGMLTVSPPAPPSSDLSSMEGEYTCRARTEFPDLKYAVAVSSIVPIRVYNVIPFSNSPQIGKPTSIPLSTYGVLPCTTPPPLRASDYYTWFLKKTDDHKDQVVNSQRTFIDQRGNLHFIYTLQSDSIAGSTYFCAVGWEQGFEFSPETFALTITTPPTNQDIKPSIVASSKTSGMLTFEVGGTATLECVFSGYEQSTTTKVPTIKWFDGSGNEIKGDSRHELLEYGRRLRIMYLEEGDEQQYKCQASNSLGNAEDSLALNVTSKPIWTDPVRKQEVVEGTDVIFNCNARSASNELPPGEPQWYRNGDIINPGTVDPQKIRFSANKKTMTIINPKKKDDIACFQCYVSNSVGISFSSGCLNVILPIVITTRPLESQSILHHVQEGTAVDLTVIATSDPLRPANFEWTFKNKTYKDPEAPPYVVYDTNTRQAYINVTKLTAAQKEAVAGVYVRKISNSGMTVFVNVALYVGEEPIPEVVEAAFPYWIIGVILAILILILVIVIIICVCCRRKMQEGDYYVDKKEKGAGRDPEKELKDSGFKDLSRLPSDHVYENHGFPEDENEKEPTKTMPPKDVDIRDIYRPPRMEPEDFDEQEYDREPQMGYNEDGSFVGQYMQRDNPSPPPTPTHEPRSPRSPGALQAPTASHESLV